MFKEFYKQDKSTIVSLIKNFLTDTLFADNPDFASNITTVISGSIASGPL